MGLPLIKILLLGVYIGDPLILGNYHIASLGTGMTAYYNEILPPRAPHRSLMLNTGGARNSDLVKDFSYTQKN